MSLASVLKGHSHRALRVLLRHGNDAPVICQSSALGTGIPQQRSHTLNPSTRQGCDPIDSLTVSLYCDPFPRCSPEEQTEFAFLTDQFLDPCLSLPAPWAHWIEETMLQVGSAELSKTHCSMGRTTAHLCRWLNPNSPNADENMETKGSLCTAGGNETGVAIMKTCTQMPQKI